jgi:lysozyme family protein
MPTVSLTDTLRREYERLFNTCTIRKEVPDTF